MKRTNKEIDNIIDSATAGIRDEAVDPAAVQAASERVWARLSNNRGSQPRDGAPEVARIDQIRGCGDFQALIPAYLTGSLSAARTLLFEDHTQECIPCRKALKQARSGGEAPVQWSSSGVRPASKSRSAVRRWAVAAAVLLVAGLGWALLKPSPFADRFTATVYAMNGPVYLISESGTRPLTLGAEIKAGETIRATNTGAEVKLPDGSIIEMKDRSELSVTDSSQGMTIRLDRGDIIVQAAKQHSRHLYVSTNDCLVSVTGTIFSVNNGTKGSRVSVLEGEVHVDSRGQDHVLHPGDQVSTNPALETVSIKDEITWSKDANRYVNLLTELAALKKELADKVPAPGLRYSSRLLDMMPDGTVFYAAIPNMTATLAESYRIINERIQQNDALKQWWSEEQAASKGSQGLDHIIGKIHEFGSYLGDEIAIGAQMSAGGEPDAPFIIAELNDPAAFRSFLNGQVAQLNGGSKTADIRIIDDPSAAAGESGMVVWIHNNILTASPKAAALQHLEASLNNASLNAASSNSAAANSFKGGSFYADIAQVYNDGAGLIVAADLERIVPDLAQQDAKSPGGAERNRAFQQLGLLNLKNFIANVKQTSGKSRNLAVLSFKPPATGIASWLAAPGPMGALDFISPDAQVVAAFVVKDPTALANDLLGAVSALDPGAAQHLTSFQSETGLDISKDLAAPLGGEYAFAIDGPLLPTPSWKVVLEVNDPTHLQQSLEVLVGKLNLWMAAEGKAGLQWTNADSGGVKFYTLRSADVGMEMDYAYVSGYLVAAPSRALVDQAIRYRASGATLAHSGRFISSLPEGGKVNFSALFYQDLGPMAGAMAGRLAGAMGNLPADKQQAIRSLVGPMLAYAYADGNRIVFSMDSDSALLSPFSLFGLSGPFGLQRSLIPVPGAGG